MYVLCLDDWVGRRLVQTEGIVMVCQLSSLGLLGFVLYYRAGALALLASRRVVERRDVMVVAGLRAQ